MTKLTGSVKRGDWERRWGRELPRDWERGRIHVDGDTARIDLKVVLLCAFIVGVMAYALAGWVG